MTSIPMSRLLLVEDDDRLAALVTRYLMGHGFDVQRVDCGEQAIASIQCAPPDVVLLDLGLPDMDGLDVCRRVRAQYNGVLCIFSAQADDIQQVLGLELGADDYITKPIEPRVLLARLRAHLRRQTSVPAAQDDVALVFGQLRIEPDSRDVHLSGQPVGLTTADFDLLVLLARNPGRIIDRETLFQGLRGIGFDGMDRSMDARISRLRRRLGDTEPDPTRIKTVRGQGYLFSPAAWE
ncbi:response regulator [Stenotrophomonas sp. CFBP 13718]|nr:response regulator [Stenotrophomonas sp. CFBP 13718]